MVKMQKIQELPGASPSGPLPGLCPGPAGGLTAPPDPQLYLAMTFGHCRWRQLFLISQYFPLILSPAKSGIWARWTSPFCRFSASFSLKYDVTDAILQDNEKMKVEYLRSLLFDLFETLQAVRTWQKNFHFKFCCYGNQNQNYCPLLKNKSFIV